MSFWNSCLENGLHIVYKRELKLDPKDKDDGEFCGLDNQITEEDLVEDESGVFEDVFVTGQRLQQISDLVVWLDFFWKLKGSATDFKIEFE